MFAGYQPGRSPCVMRMSNYLGVEPVVSTVMVTETERPRVGLRHPTVVPTNFVADDVEADDPQQTLPV